LLFTYLFYSVFLPVLTCLAAAGTGEEGIDCSLLTCSAVCSYLFLPV